MTHTDPTAARRHPRAHWLALVGIGLAAGYLSGLFGVGGGTVVVPLLLLLGVDQRVAAGTSVAAILPSAIVGSIGYSLSGDVDWIAGLLLAVGIVVGAQVGTWLLARLPREPLFWAFLGFLGVVVVSLWIVVPQRDDTIELDLAAGLALIATGVVTGILSGLFGVGGGIITTPALMFVFGASDLVAKGTSLLMMVPGSISATFGNLRRRNVDLRIGAIVGLAACAASPLGVLTSHAITPFWSNVGFSVFLLAISVQLAVRRIRSYRAKRVGA
ncbi:TSUP family transporter [Agromyces sp. CFH 90414]|uniref:Probable membrane transporter protein n=1 Tax=Agromyces agglutinans TaxID=2662258 RepID=A0A6I2F2W6_9MICO|nr:sulfite exporter TauE/SafE family protein [Agromyces agglutinans]MRG58872.1 TSUP family transporter [Agromyces agglutinans]